MAISIPTWCWLVVLRARSHSAFYRERTDGYCFLRQSEAGAIPAFSRKCSTLMNPATSWERVLGTSLGDQSSRTPTWPRGQCEVKICEPHRALYPTGQQINDILQSILNAAYAHSISLPQKGNTHNFPPPRIKPPLPRHCPPHTIPKGGLKPTHGHS